MIMKKYSFLLDIKREEVLPVFEFVQGDIGACALDIHLKDMRNHVDLTGLASEIVFAKPDGTTVVQDEANGVSVTDAASGKIACVLKTNTIAAPGKVHAEVRLLEGEKLLTTARFSFSVRKAILNNETVESMDEYPALQRLADGVGETLESLQSSVNGVGEALTGLQADVDGMGEAIEVMRSNLINVKNFGAKGNGMTDDTTPILNAINSLKSKGGGILFFPIGVFLGKIVIDSVTNFKIVGCGAGSVIKLPSNDTGNVVNISNSTSVIIEDIVVDGNRDNNALGTNEELQNGLRLTGCSFITVRNVTVQNCWMSGIKLGGWAGWADNPGIVNDERGCDTVLVEGCTIYHTYDQGIGVWSSERIRVIGNTITDGGWAGISFTHSNNSVADGNVSSDNIYTVHSPSGEGTGIAIEGGWNNVLSNNVCDHNNATGIRIDNAPQDTTRYTQKCIIANNICSRTLNGGQGVYVGHALDTSLNCNQCVDNSSQGIRVSEDADNIKIVDNICKSNGDVGLLIKGLRMQVTGNTLESNAREGVLIMSTKNSVIANNSVVNNGIGTGSAGIDLRGVRNSSVSGNVCNNNEAQGIAIKDDGSIASMYNVIANNILVDDQSSHTQSRALEELDNSDYNLCMGNIAYGNTDGQISIKGTHSVSVNNLP